MSRTLEARKKKLMGLANTMLLRRERMHDIYEQLRSNLGMPLTDSGGEMEILKMLFTKEEAEIAILLTPDLETVNQLSVKTGIAKGELATILAYMAEKGTIWQDKREDEPRYRLMPFVPGIYEAQAMRIDKQQASAFEKIFPALARGMIGLNMPIMKTLPAEQSISGMEVNPDQKASWWISQVQTVALTDCICKKQQKLVGRGCSRPMDSICIYLSPWAEFFIDAGIARKATLAEAVKALERAENGGLVHMVYPTSGVPFAICNCCPDCCIGLRVITEFNAMPSQMVISDFHSTVDIELCNGCEACIAICTVSAISMEEERAVVNADRCIGCGLCVLECPEGATSLATRKQEV